MAEWSELPCDILERISSFCIIHDHIRMQYVRKSWRSILKNTNRELPFLMMLPNDNEEDPDARDFFSLSNQKIHSVHLPEIRGKRCCGSFPNGWLMIVEHNLDIFLFHPWSKRRIDLPHPSTFKIYGHLGYYRKEIPNLDKLKVAISDDGKVLVIAYASRLGDLAFCRIGDDVYTYIDFDPAVEDVIYHKGNFYLFTGHESLYLLHIEEEEDGSSPHIEKRTVDLEDDFKIPYRIFRYLVPDVLTDSMFVIIRDVERIGGGNDSDEEEDLPHKTMDLPHKTIHFDIFKVSLEESKTLKMFKKVENLGDRVLFLGIILSLSSWLASSLASKEIAYILQTIRQRNIMIVCMDAAIQVFSVSFMDYNPSLFILRDSSEIFKESSYAYAYEVST